MDATAKPLRIPPEMRTYAEQHSIFDLIQAMMKRLLVEKPEDPIEYLIDLLKNNSIEVPRIFVLGPPASGKRTVVKQLCKHLGASRISTESLLREESDLVKEALEYKANQQEIPSMLWINLVQQRLSKKDCIKRGWVFEGFPKTREQAFRLQAAGIAPEHVVLLDAPDTVLIERNLGKRIDPVTGDVYHTSFDWPSSEHVEKRLVEADGIWESETVAGLLEYQRNIKGLESTYSTVSRVINADQPSIDVFSQVLTFVLSRHRSVAPHTPRILLHGPPGSGKSLQAALIAQKYNIVNICCGQVLKAVAADETSQGELIKPGLETGQQVPDSTVLKILTERLSRLDCTTRGWVVHGCPRNLEQAEKLNSAGFTPNRVFFLDMPDEVAVERVTFRMTDPVTGQRYHSLYKAAPSQQIQDRLQVNPRDSAESLQRRLDLYRTNLPELQELYSDAIYVNADQDPHAIFEFLESHIVNRLPKPLSHRWTPSSSD
ncbi:adenylate kinase 8-like isoform X1 [Acipenser ruthenus]|uniref:adenylate kinase 8-like isoform X1 n=1 Tax=Acipenser ruthenus TaxID=7906 RepID=UPI002740AB37|nr:adenylate kinase 8-like isoform X1 [Acipenser ruthenus]